MKLFYTRKEVEEEINKEFLRRERERDQDHRIDCIQHDYFRLEERVQRLEMQGFEVKHFPGSGGTGTVQPEFCNCKEEKS